MAYPSGQLTRASIVNRALRKAGNTALSAGPDYEAQIWLNQILFDLYSQFDWSFLRVYATITINGSSVLIPTAPTVGSGTFLRPINDIALTITAVDGQTQGGLIREVDQRTFDMLFAFNPTISASIPDVYVVAYQFNSLYFYPVVTSTITAAFNYIALPAEIPIDTTGDSTVPTFPWHDYLIQALFVATLEYEMDGRADTEAQKREAMLQRIRNIAFPSRAAEPTIPLDVNVFGAPFRGDFDGGGWLR